MRDSNLLQIREIQVGFELEAAPQVTKCLEMFETQRKTATHLTRRLHDDDLTELQAFILEKRCRALATLMRATHEQVDRLLRMAGIPMPCRGKLGKASANGIPILDLPSSQEESEPIPEQFLVTPSA